MIKLKYRHLFVYSFPIFLTVTALILLFAFFGSRDTFLENAFSNRYYNIVDRNGITLMNKEKDSEENRYSKDPQIRKSTFAIVGDPSCNIKTSICATKRKDEKITILNGNYAAIHNDSIVELTIDAELSKKCLEALDGSERGVILISNYKTGEIVTCISMPYIDPQDMPLDIDTNPVYEGAFLNKAFESSYAPGSIFKIATLSAYFETGHRQYNYRCRGRAAVFDEKKSTTVTCANGAIHGDLDLYSMTSQSCNCGFANMALMIGKKDYQEFIKNSGICSSISIDNIETKSGNYEVTNDIELAWAAVGQGKTMINPATYIQFINSVANGGSTPALYFLKSSKTQKNIEVISKSTADRVKDILKSNGVAYSKIHSYPNSLCAKTGTAEVGEDKTPTSLFVGFLDDSEKPYSILVIIEKGGYGITTAGRIASDILAYL